MMMMMKSRGIEIIIFGEAILWIELLVRVVYNETKHPTISLMKGV